MRAKERNMEVSNYERVIGSMVLGARHADPKVSETYNRPPYWPVLNITNEEKEE